MSQSTTQDSKIPKKETSTTPDTTRFEPTKEDTTPQKIMKSKEVMPSEEIRAEITRIFTEKQWTVIQQPDKTMKNNTHIDIIAITITLTAAMKYCYHILPIKLVPLRGTLVYGTQRFSYLGHEQKWTDQKIVDEYISEFLLDVEQLKSFVNSNSAEFRALSDTRPIHLTETKDEKGTISYHYEKRPAVIAIKPIIIYTGSLEIEKCADHLPIKYIENLGLYVCEPKKITMLIEYIMTKRDRASVSPVLSQIRQDIEHIRTQIWGRKKKLLLGVLCFQFLTLFLSVGQILSDATYLTLTIIPIVPVVGFWLYVNHSNREIPIIRGERDLIRPQNERYLQPHIEWMISSQSDDFIAQYLMGRVVCENLKGFKGRGADLFSQRVSGSSSWSLTGQFRSRIKLLCERFGLGLSFVSPHYTSKIGYFADDNEPEAVAGYYASCKIVNGIPVLKLFDSPRVEVAAGSITSYLQSARSVVYEYRDGRFVGKDGAPFPGKKLSRALLRVFKVGRGFQPGDQYVEVSSGKWVRYKRTSDIYYLDRDYNSSINLAAYNEFGFTIKRLVVMRNRVSSGVREDESKRRLSSFGVHFLSLCKSLEKKNIRYLIDYAGVGANVKGFFQSSYKSLGIDSIPDSFK